MQPISSYIYKSAVDINYSMYFMYILIIYFIILFIRTNVNYLKIVIIKIIYFFIKVESGKDNTNENDDVFDNMEENQDKIAEIKEVNFISIY